ncbi:hypothetical protein [Pedobacter arcticus]|uniref:hypothetical protein n=1 Tax=Pedobacter arcticus TaxID=752140 RepID=UPI0002EEFEFE|nr:hypothetical protein [Pedobacter arcticus]
MKPKLIILSDLWGKANFEWTAYYITILKKHFEISYYDSCELGDIDTLNYTEDNLHQQFNNGGIDKAVENLYKLEPELSIVLGFSVGGYIAWKALLNHKMTNHIFAVSSTRLRKETTKPNGKINLFFGENDIYKPNNEWFKTLALKKQLIKNEGHNFYRNPVWAEKLCQEIIQKTTTQSS